MAVPGKTHGEGTTKSTAPPVGPAQAIKAHRCKEEQGAVKLALSSQGQHKVTAKGEAPEPGRTHGVEAQRCKEERGAVKLALISQFHGKHTVKAPAQGSGRAQAVEPQWLRKQGAVKPALTSQFQGKLAAKGKASEMRPAQPIKAQRGKEEERGPVKPALASQFLGKYTAKASAPEAGCAQAVESEILRGGRAGEKICDGRVLEANKELSGPHGAQPPMIIPTIVIESPSSSEHSLPEEPIYDTSLLMPPPRIHKRRRSRERAQKRKLLDSGNTRKTIRADAVEHEKQHVKARLRTKDVSRRREKQKEQLTALTG
ncbi:uncharacterized protein LOC121112570 [Gallus gallus]|uniref:uncharacterized protein LOC121106972 n=1 Tax=Gallus gallus TaxID=9031 RepID=UPI001AE299A9|nr:uncharacterized protein LOC121106972 [Gallus gallus]XP_040550283.1 uncharacterized protein LOC121112570 [Gallus gallus]